MTAKEMFPIIWIVTPVYNAAKALPDYLKGIEQTSYPKDQIHIIMPDGGSSDNTVALAKKAGALVIDNPLKTAEAGKAEGVKHVLEQIKKEKGDTRNNFICLLDSDNYIIETDWFDRMVEPLLNDPEIIGSEPWEYTWRKTDGYITRYTSMTSANDPVCIFLGNYDRLNILSGTWTGLPIKTIDKNNYFYWTVDPKVLPTIGANGTVFRSSFFEVVEIKDFLFDIDVLYEYTKTKKAKFAKVKNGIVHIYCRTVNDFIRKQRRRITDYTYFQAMGLRTYPWNTLNKKGLIVFILSCITIVPLLWQVAVGFSRKPDIAWLFHPIACWLTLWIYGTSKIAGKFKKPALADRTNWQQS